MAAAHHPEVDIIEGEFRVLASRPLPRRSSPNRRRMIARIVLWHAAVVLAVILVPRLFA